MLAGFQNWGGRIMQKSKTQNSVSALSGLQGVFNFEQLPSSPDSENHQQLCLSGYRVDHRSTVQPIWGDRQRG